jgi:ABC-type uncharacterized transport system permease subunit
LLVIWLNTNQYATGLALSCSAPASRPLPASSYVQAKMPERPLRHSRLGDIPLIGPALFRHHPMVYLTVLRWHWR